MSECQSDTWHMDAWGDDDPAFLTSAASGASADANRDSDPDAWKVFLTSEAEALLESECAPAQTVTSVDPCHSIYSISSAADVFTEAEPASTASATDLFETVESSSVLPNDPEGKQDAESEDIDMSDMWSFADVLDLGSQQPVPNTTHTDLVSRLQRAQVHSRDARAKSSRKLERKQIGAQSAAASSSHTGPMIQTTGDQHSRYVRFPQRPCKPSRLEPETLNLFFKGRPQLRRPKPDTYTNRY